MDKYLLSVIFRIQKENGEYVGWRHQAVYLEVKEVNHTSIEGLHLAIDSCIVEMIEEANREWVNRTRKIGEINYIADWIPISHSLSKV